MSSTPLVDLNGDAPSCPPNSLQRFGVAYPSLMFTFAILALTSLALGLITLFKYNSVKVFKRTIRRETISNTFWIAYFFTVALRTAFQCIISGISSPKRHYIDNIFQLVILIIQGISAFSLSLSLNHQRRYRSKPAEIHPNRSWLSSAAQHEARVYAPPQSSQLSGTKFGAPNTYNSASFGEKRYLLPPGMSSINAGGSGAADVSRAGFLKRTFFSAEAIFFVLFVAYLVGLYLKAANAGTPRSGVVYWVFIGIYALQRVPPVVLVCIIVLSGVCSRRSSKSSNDSDDTQETYEDDGSSKIGPSGWAKAFLIVGTILHAVNDLPYDFWADILTQAGCVFYIASWLDMIHILYLLSFLLFFFFLRSEYKRNLEDCLWEAVSDEPAYDYRPAQPIYM